MQKQRDTSLGELLTDLAGQVEHLVSQHVKLARQEFTADGQKLVVQGVGIAFGLLLAVLGLAFVGVALMAGLQVWLAPWAAALIVAMFYLGAGVLIVISSVRRIGELNPTGRTREEVQETLAWLTRKK
ncbi:MAG: phage holin family protein [Gemmatimonadaceae bacterium]|nr:phage holin family protein [Gloeobacterales cyanobacterium ES-bin-141]